MTPELRHITSQKDIDACIKLQQLIWGLDDIGTTSPITLKALTMTKPEMGVLLGAFDRDRLLGFSLTMGTLEPHTAYGHMLGVSPEHQNQGIGRSIQLAVQNELLKRDITRMYWTFEPLESRNSYLYLNKIGGVVTAYEQNYYHVENQMQKDLPLDRMVLSLNLTSPNISQKRLTLEEAERLYPVATPASMPKTPEVLVPIPTDISTLIENYPQKALQVRLESRAIFTEYINNRGYKGVHVINEQSGSSPTSYFMLKKDF